MPEKLVYGSGMDDLFLVPLVIMRRLPQLWFEALHPNPLVGDETWRAVNEKLAAFGEGVVGANVEAFRAVVELGSAVASGKLSQRAAIEMPERIARAALAPAVRRVKANARRLGRI